MGHGRSARRRRWGAPVALATALLALSAARRPAAAQATGGEVRTDRFVILYEDAAAADAAQIAAFSDPVAEGIAEALGVALPRPLTLRVFATTDAFLAAQPLALEIDGVIARSPREAREIALSAERAAAAGPDGLRIALRHDLVAVAANELSRGTAPDLWVEGLAEALGPPASAATGVARLRAARAAGPLHPWSDLAAPGAAFLDPPITYPEAASVARFLLERDGLDALARLYGALPLMPLEAALEQVYGVSAGELEAQWARWLPAYLDGGWQDHPLYPADLTGVGTLMAASRYQEAAAVLASAAAFAGVDDPALGRAMAALGEQAASGVRAQEGLGEASARLADGEYAPAAASAAEAAEGFTALGDDAGAAAAGEVGRRAGIGLAADRDLAAARSAPPWSAPVARTRARSAAAGFAEVGNEAGVAEAAALLAGSDQRQRPVGALLAVFGGVLLFANARARRRSGRGLVA